MRCIHYSKAWTFPLWNHSCTHLTSYWLGDTPTSDSPGRRTVPGGSPRRLILYLYNINDVRWTTEQWPPLRVDTGRWVTEPMASLMCTYLMNDTFISSDWCKLIEGLFSNNVCIGEATNVRNWFSDANVCMYMAQLRRTPIMLVTARWVPSSMHYNMDFLGYITDMVLFRGRAEVRRFPLVNVSNFISYLYL